MCCWLWTLCHTIQHRAVLIIFPLNLQIITITQMVSKGLREEKLTAAECAAVWCHIISRSSLVIAITNCYIGFTYFTFISLCPSMSGLFCIIKPMEFSSCMFGNSVTENNRLWILWNPENCSLFYWCEICTDAKPTAQRWTWVHFYSPKPTQPTILTQGPNPTLPSHTYVKCRHQCCRTHIFYFLCPSFVKFLDQK